MKGLLDYYRCPKDLVQIVSSGDQSSRPSFFSFNGVRCWGALSTSIQRNGDRWHDVVAHATLRGKTLCLPFDLSDISDNLRFERYWDSSPEKGYFEYPHFQKTYYSLRRFLPTHIRQHQQRTYFSKRLAREFPRWPVDRSVDELFEAIILMVLKSGVVEEFPFVWFWPNGYSSCTMLTHDVETVKGRDFCLRLMEMDEAAGLRSSFQLVPEQRYTIPPELLNTIRERGFEINVHDLNHDGLLFADNAEFIRRAEKINEYAKSMGARGFRSGTLYRNQDWFDAFEFEYDMSVPNAGHLEAQFGGCCTVMPYFVKSILELPFTTVQDYVLFELWADYSIDLWKKQAGLISEKHGLINFLTHPDYICESRARYTYCMLLDFIQHLRTKENVWFALPGQVNDWWRARSEMNVVKDGHGCWHIEGRGKERARLAFAKLHDGRLAYELEGELQTTHATTKHH